MQVDDGRDITKESKYNEMRRNRKKFDAQSGSKPLQRAQKDPKKMGAPGDEKDKSGKQIQAVNQNPDQEDEAFYEIARGIRKAVEVSLRIQQKRQQSQIDSVMRTLLTLFLETYINKHEWIHLQNLVV